MELFLIDAVGPFFRTLKKNRINWSKIPFSSLETTGNEAEQQWQRIHQDMMDFATEVSSLGYNAVTLDDLAHLATHPLHEPEVAERIRFFRNQFNIIFDQLTKRFGLKIFLTSDVIPVTPAIHDRLSGNSIELENYYLSLIKSTLADFPQLSGIILRIGESDGLDVDDPIRTQLFLHNPKETNRLLRKLLPEFEATNKKLILRTWTIGAYKIGDLIWHHGTLSQTLDGIDSPNFIVSMKHGESDFFRHIPLNQAFFHVKHPKIIELQARREYEGAGEFPSFIGTDCEHFYRELQEASNVVGISVWCQTGGWHRFRRLAFLSGNRHSDIWIRINVAVAIHIFRYNMSIDQSIESILGRDRSMPALELLRHAETVVNKIYYIEDFAHQKIFFRRVRIPPLLHIYWDRLFINHAVAKILRYFVANRSSAVSSAEEAYQLFPKMIHLAHASDLPVDDIKHMRDFFNLIVLARRYYFQPYNQLLAEEIRAAKTIYKQQYPSKERNRFRIKISFEPFHIKRLTISWLLSILLRKKRGYRLIDHIFTIHLLGFIYRVFKPRNPKRIPKLMRKSAMGIDAIFK